MVLLLAELHAKPEAAEAVEQHLRALVASTSREPGSVIYSVYRDQANAQRFIVHELYRDEAARDAHLASAPLQAALAAFDSLLAAPPGLTFGTLLGAHVAADAPSSTR